MLECVINVSEGTHKDVVRAIATAAGSSLLDVHSDPVHNRSVFSLASDDIVEDAVAVTGCALERVELSEKSKGPHPRLGVVDVVPFVPLGDADLGDAIAARDLFSTRASQEFDLPCFCYGPERSLPEVRRRAFVDLWPDTGPRLAKPRIGACCVGARPVLVAYNLWIDTDDLTIAKTIAKAIRSREVRALGFQVGDRIQVSMNLIAPDLFGPLDAYRAVEAHVAIESAELVGLVPQSVLEAIPQDKWAMLDLSLSTTIEYRLKKRR